MEPFSVGLSLVMAPVRRCLRIVCVVTRARLIRMPVRGMRIWIAQQVKSSITDPLVHELLAQASISLSDLDQPIVLCLRDVNSRALRVVLVLHRTHFNA